MQYMTICLLQLPLKDPTYAKIIPRLKGILINQKGVTVKKRGAT